MKVVPVRNPLLSLLETIEDPAVMRPVLVVGDVMLDRFVYGDVERISPEAPVPVLRVKREDQMLGGAGNALANLAGLGAAATLCAVIGSDADGQAIKTCMETLGCRAAVLVVDPTRPTIVKTRFLAGHQQLLRADYERVAALGEGVSSKILAHLSTLIPESGAVLLSDYGKGLLSPAVIAEIIALARAHCIPVIVDPKGQDFSIYRGASVLTPNRKELSDATKGAPTKTDEEVCRAAESLIETCGIEAIVATRSGDGMSVIRLGQPPVHLRTTDLEVFDVSGAGDTVIATLAAALAAGAALEDAAALANVAGSLVVTKVGTAPIRMKELRDLLESDQGDVLTKTGREREKGDRARRGDILDWDAATEQVRRWKARGLTVGLTNGCFDILHFGHVSYLNQARDRCDRMIVALNTDSSVRILKGPDRPVHDETSRASVLAGLGAVDMVVMFGAQEACDDNTARALLARLKPDVYFKGGDYTESQIPEAPTVRAYGGQVEIMGAYDGHSTTASLARQKAAKK